MSPELARMAQDGLPSWAIVSPRRAAHIERVVAVLALWADRSLLSDSDAARWCRAGWLHDALRDASEAKMRELVPGSDSPTPLLHGPASAELARRNGESDLEILDAVAWHTVGSVDWGLLGRALYCADFLEPGRKFLRTERSEMASRFPAEPDSVLREVLKLRIARSRESGLVPAPETMALFACAG
jgi:HD superfamily phosphohydrolase YqeK